MTGACYSKEKKTCFITKSETTFFFSWYNQALNPPTTCWNYFSLYSQLKLDIRSSLPRILFFLIEYPISLRRMSHCRSKMGHEKTMKLNHSLTNKLLKINFSYWHRWFHEEFLTTTERVISAVRIAKYMRGHCYSTVWLYYLVVLCIYCNISILMSNQD